MENKEMQQEEFNVAEFLDGSCDNWMEAD